MENVIQKYILDFQCQRVLDENKPDNKYIKHGPYM